jgi:hypothetical protein
MPKYLYENIGFLDFLGFFRPDNPAILGFLSG